MDQAERQGEVVAPRSRGSSSSSTTQIPRDASPDRQMVDKEKGPMAAPPPNGRDVEGSSAGPSQEKPKGPANNDPDLVGPPLSNERRGGADA